MRPNRRTLIVLALVALAVLIAAPAALAAAGGGTGSFSGGGGGGGFGGGGGGGGKGFALFLIFRALIDIALIGHGLGLLFLIAIGLVVWFLRSGAPKMSAAWQARRESGRAERRRTQKRERKVELAAAEAADEDDRFDPEHVRTAAAALFTQIQFAWDDRDRVRLRGLVATSLLAEWERRLDELDRQGWRNRVQPLDEPTVEYVGLAREGGDDRVVVRIEARMRDFVVDNYGRHLKRRGQFTETVRMREYWTLLRRDDHWVLASIEQGSEGAHALTDKIVQTEWADEDALRDQAMVEQAAAEAVPDPTMIPELADLQFSGDARSAANDLSLADGRFAPDVLEIAARQAVAAWAEAVDGPDQKLRAMAEPPALAELLYAGDHSGRRRVVVRGPQIKQIQIAALDAAHRPPTMTLDVAIRGRRYVQDRDTTQVVSGSSTRTIEFAERWVLELTDDPQRPWRIASVQTPTAA
ncbi:MAG TPA: TIM44-like domain-containing protein [Solirubrobacteraceae bacterium]|nr:TIM44-like domain-containing protein [Solirubrobacteraceae bacterium]